MVPGKSIIHIGLHKTGSTTLQHCLGKATRELLNQGFFYPVGHLDSRFQHSELANYIRAQAQAEFEAALRRILDDLARLNGRALILSGEAFSKLTVEQVALLHESLARAGRQFHILLYIRNLYKYALSLIAQKSRTLGLIAYPHTVLRGAEDFDPSSIVSTWEQVFGTERVHVFCLDALPNPRDIVGHFADFSGFRLPADTPVPEMNRSVDPIASALLTQLVHEFRLPQELFYKAYFETAHGRVALPRVEHHLNRIVGPWVKGINLTHPKLKPFRHILCKRPSFDAAAEPMAAHRYLELLSVVLANTSRDLARATEDGDLTADAARRGSMRRKRRKRRPPR